MYALETGKNLFLTHSQKAKGHDRPRVVLCPTGPFTFLPLHAAGIHCGDMAARECVSDYVVCSYVPTLLALQRARKGASPKHPGDLSILAIAEGSAPGMPALDRVDQEVRSVCESAEKASLRVLSTRTTGTSTIQHAISNFADADIVHLACHGVQDAKDALQSGFCLGDGRLTVAELMKLKLPGPFLAFLSACETAKGDETLPDQTVHLAAAMLFCGFQNVIGTMW
jgi:CHAT domain-containing protein